MAAPAAPPQQAPQQRAQTGAAVEAQVVGTLAVVLASAMPMTAVSAAAVPLLAMLGIPPREGVKALSLVVPHDLPLQAPGPVENRVAVHEALYRARYLVNAAQRLKGGASFEQERAFAQQHIGAQAARAEAARKVDQAALTHGPLLGWYAVMDSSTDPICRNANGKNFNALDPPKIGLPGTLHGGMCRCRAGAPHATRAMVGQPTQPDVIPFPVELTNERRRRFERARSVLSRSHDR